MKYVNTRWTKVNGGTGTGSGARDPLLDKELLKRLAVDMNVNTSVRSKDMKPTLVISYDDSVLEDYTLAFPVHQKYKVPGEINAISGFMLGTTGYLPDAGTKLPLTKAQALEMQSAGWEFAVHGKRHLSVSRLNLRLTPAIGTDKLHVAPEFMHRWTHTLPYQIDLQRTGAPQVRELNKVIGHGTDANGAYLQVEAPLQAGNYTFFRLSDAEIETEIKGCVDELTTLGLHVKHHASPYSASTWAARRIIRKYCASARRGGPSVTMIPGTTDVFPTFQLRCFVEKTSNSNTQLDAWLDQISSVNGFSILMEHTWRPGFSAAGLDYIIAGALARGMEVTTRSKALEMYGNLLELGDPFAGEDPTEAVQPYYVVDRTGKVFENIKDLSDLLKMPY